MTVAPSVARDSLARRRPRTKAASAMAVAPTLTRDLTRSVIVINVCLSAPSEIRNGGESRCGDRGASVRHYIANSACVRGRTRGEFLRCGASFNSQGLSIN